MEQLTVYKAVVGELEPYTVSPVTISKALTDEGLEGEEAYTKEMRKEVAVAAISVLRKLIVLTSDSLGKSSQGYSVDGLKSRIKALCKENGLDPDDYIDGVPTIEDGSMYW